MIKHLDLDLSPVRHASFMRRGDVVLFQGDSITDAFRKPDEINNAYQLGSGYAFMVAARFLHARPTDGLQFHNRGVAGNTLGDLHGRWLADAIALRPSVISLLAGINDAACEVNGAPDYTADAFERGYRSLLERSQSELPGVRFVLCEPFALPCGLVNERWIAPLHQRQKIVMSLAREFDAVFVPLQREFDAASQRAPLSYWLYDGIHPTAQSHQMIAGAWLRAVDRPVRRRRRRLDRARVN